MNRFNIKEKAHYVGSLRTANVTLMETMAAWVPSSAELEAKVLFGRHLWDLAQHADLLGKRVFELRAPLHFSPPLDATYAGWLKEIAAMTSTQDRLAAFYEGVLPAMTARHQHYLERTDHLQDEPTVRILERIIQDHARMHGEHQEVLKQVPSLAKNAPEWSKRLAQGEPGLALVHRPPVEWNAAAEATA
jgi:hypothetical protein